MSSSIFKDLAEIRERQEREDRLLDEMFKREEQRIYSERAWSPEIIHESEWCAGFGSECKEYLGEGTDGRFYYGLEIGEEDLSWHGPYETRGEAEEQLQAAYERWDKRVGEREEAWEAEQIAELEKRALQVGDKIRLERARQQSLNLELGPQQEITL